MKQSSKESIQSTLFDTSNHLNKSELNARNKDDTVFDIIDALSAPILTFSQSWADSIPQRLLSQVPMARMISLMRNDKTATDIECIIYILTRTLEAPINQDWVDIYIHICCKTFQNLFKEDFWNDLNAPRKLSEWHITKLNNLRKFIYDRRRKALKETMKNEVIEDINKTPEEQPKESKENNPITQQGSFEF